MIPVSKRFHFALVVAGALVSLFLLYSVARAPAGDRGSSHTVGNRLSGLSSSFKNPFSSAPSLPPPSEEEYLAFCVAHRNQLEDLPEFFVHHYVHHGVRRFYMMDDRSDPPLSSSTMDFVIPRSAISFQRYDQDQIGMQEHIYADCARLFGPLHKWMAFIDADEFFATSDGNPLTTFLHELDEHEDVGALGVNWRLHSSANLTTRPESMRQAFISCPEDGEEMEIDKLPEYRDNRLIKSVVKTALFEKPLSPHMFKTRNGTHTVGEHLDVINDGDGLRQPITRDRVGLHHFTVKSREQFEAKTKIWSAKGWEYWNHIEGLPQVPCYELTQYNP